MEPQLQPERLNRILNVTVPKYLHDRLCIAAAKRMLPIAAITRQAIHAWLEHSENATPRCADGTECLCPNRWLRTTTTEDPTS